MGNKLLAIKVTRRTVAVAVFRERQLYYAEVRHLSSKAEQAESSAIAFVSWCVEYFRVRFAALEDAVASEEARSASIISRLRIRLQAQGIPCQIVGKHTLFESYATVPLASRTELYPVIATLWPQLDPRDFHTSVLDAAAVGLYFQVENLLSQ
jgi:hypothetical protein